jgi:hypothetical protein
MCRRRDDRKSRCVISFPNASTVGSRRQPAAPTDHAAHAQGRFLALFAGNPSSGGQQVPG